jgi:Tol biopolymer transport system component
MRWFIGLGLVVAMFAFGFGVYHAAGYLRAERNGLHRPTEVSAPSLPGTMYLVQSGAIYRFQKGTFTQITSEAGWMQPSSAPNDKLVVVRRQGNYSDLYLLTTGGRTVSQLTHEASGTVEANHWVFYPRFSPDGKTVFYDFDPKDAAGTYRTDLAIFASPIDPGSRAVAVGWTQPNPYTGGDVTPIPLRNGALIYTKYSVDDRSQVHSQIWIQRRPGSRGLALTAPELDCAQPAVSPDEKLLAMVCSKGSNLASDLDVAPLGLDSLTLGTPTTLVGDKLIASPAFSPDGRTIAFLAPTTAGGRFQLWTVASAGQPTPRSISNNLGFDSNSAPVWVEG